MFSQSLMSLISAPLLILIAALSSSVCSAADLTPPRHFNDLFSDDRAIEVSLRAPLKELLKDYAEKPEQRAAELVYLDPVLNTTVTHALKVRARGNSRRNRKNCRFPPLRLNFPKRAVEGSLFAGQDKLKLVTHCVRLGDRSTRSLDGVELEFLVYRMLNVLTDRSLRVRRLDIRYEVTDDDNASFTHPGFLIESDQQLAARQHLRRIEVEAVDPNLQDHEYAALIEMFQYMIGNTDFSIVRSTPGDKCCHNARTFADGETIVSVPYDFDATGFVSPKYAQPAPEFRLSSVRQRLYRGYCRPGDLMAQTRSHFLAARPRLESLITGSTRLSKRARGTALKYLAGFYRDIGSDERFTRRIAERCR